MSVQEVLVRMSQIQGAMTSSIGGGAVLPGGTTSTGASFDAVLGQQINGTQAISSVQGGTAGQRMVALAQQEIGVKEQPPGSNDSPRIKEYRAATAGSGVGPWCAYFTSWLAKSAGAPVGEQGQGFGSVDALYGWAQRTGRAVQNGPNVHPAAGDLIVWDEHIGLVESVDADGTVHTIEGNSSDQVIRRTHDAGSALGYVKVG
ncbi:MAG: CHAP domain-containing protein [Solirubrobacteraceae bacterium]|nr:CHAP domain-containing protein [Solirubrobacteraceae bacterium]